LDSKSFSILVKENQEKVYFFVRRMVLDHDDTNDVVQNTFIKAWKGIHSFRQEAKFSTWLTRIAYNESINFIQKRNRQNNIPIDEYSSNLPSVLEADKYYSGDDIQKLLQSALASLPEKQKAVFIMKYYKELKYDDISEITGTSVGALKASYHLAVKKIEKILKTS